MSAPASKLSIDGARRAALRLLWQAIPGWLDTKELQKQLVMGRALGVALKQLADEGIIQSARGPRNVFIYRVVA